MIAFIVPRMLGKVLRTREVVRIFKCLYCHREWI
jgi:hypothetical protein